MEIEHKITHSILVNRLTSKNFVECESLQGVLLFKKGIIK